jgi:tagaturonate epimerase
MDRLLSLLDYTTLAPPLAENEARGVAEQLARMVGAAVYPKSITAAEHAVYFLARRDGGERLLAVLVAEGGRPAEGLRCDVQALQLGGKRVALCRCRADHASALALRRVLPFLAPRTFGLARSFGCGDRLGLATPGHVRALSGLDFAPLLAQQSIREMTRTRRSPEQVLDDTTWGVLQEGWRLGYGADADHLKTTAHVEACVSAGYTFYTIDPGDHVDNGAETDAADIIQAKFDALPWSALDTTAADLRHTYEGRRFKLPGSVTIDWDSGMLLRAAVKYGPAIAHTARLYWRLAELLTTQPFELEMSVDETATPTTVAEHFFVANELRRMGVRWVSLAPRYSGRFEKGVDYIGDLTAFEKELLGHVAVAQHLGPYKLSLHSGSDKFSVYPIIARHAGEHLHVKTAGTSYLEALRAIARVEPELFREIAAYAVDRYPEDRASYHVSAEVTHVPGVRRMAAAQLPTLLDDFDARQVLHVTFGSVLTVKAADGSFLFRDRFYAALAAHEEEHYVAVSAHIRRHLELLRG